MRCASSETEMKKRKTSHQTAKIENSNQEARAPSRPITCLFTGLHLYSVAVMLLLITGIKHTY